MGLFNREVKTVQEITDKYFEQVNEFILDGESVEAIFPLMRDFLCITSKRLIFVYKDFSFKEPKSIMFSIAYNNIVALGLEKSEHSFAFMDEIILVTREESFKLKFIKEVNVKEVYNKIAEKIM